MTTDRIEKSVVLKASRSQVWRALTSADQFGAWFGAKMNGPFVAGMRATGRITIPDYDHLNLELLIDRIEPESLFSYRWHPYAVEADVDYSSEPMTLVEFHLADDPGGIKLTVIESGFDQIPIARRATAYRMNDGGWAGQMQNIARYVTGLPQ
ncbi:MAG: SRPBCC family protein [Hyphomicrobium sp.]|jgi:uncharacterized protein YndB with AHSA1/START domain